MEKYYYQFAIQSRFGEKEYYKHFAEEGLDEDGLNVLETKLMKELEVDYCAYVGEGWSNEN